MGSTMLDAVGQFAGAKYLNLETFRKTGIGVRTPVWFAQDVLHSAPTITVFYIYSELRRGSGLARFGLQFTRSNHGIATTEMGSDGQFALQHYQAAHDRSGSKRESLSGSLMSALAGCGHCALPAEESSLCVSRGDACAVERASSRLQQPCHLHRRPLAASRRRDAALVQARCNSPQ
jgi:hypothetical protein